MRTNASTGKIRQTYEFIKADRKRFNASRERFIGDAKQGGLTDRYQNDAGVTENPCHRQHLLSRQLNFGNALHRNSMG